MPNIELLKEYIDDSGMTKTAIADKAGMLRETLYNRLDGRGQFTASEIVGLTNALKLSKSERDKIFLLSNVN